MKVRLVFWLLNIVVYYEVTAQKIPKVPADMPAYRKEMSAMVNTRTTQMIEWKYIIYDGNVTTERYKTRITKFDQLGRMQENITLDKKGNKRSILIFSYISGDLPEKEVEYLVTGEVLGKTVYSYNESGYLDEITWYHGNDYIIDKTIYEVDEENNKVAELYMFSPDSVEKKIVYHYTDIHNGFVDSEEIFRGQDQFQYMKKYIRNGGTGIKREEWYNKDNEKVFIVEYMYTPEGKLGLKEKVLPGGQRIKVAEYNYTSLLLTAGEILYNSNGEIVLYRKFSYK